MGSADQRGPVELGARIAHGRMLTRASQQLKRNQHMAPASLTFGRSSIRTDGTELGCEADGSLGQVAQTAWSQSRGAPHAAGHVALVCKTGLERHVTQWKLALHQ